MKPNRKNPLLLAAITVAGLGFSASSLSAQTWTGTTDAFWTSPDNWSPSGAPVAGAAVQFDGTGANLATNFNASPFTLNSLTFSAAQTAPVSISTTFASPLSFTPGTVLSVAAGSHSFVGTGTAATDRDLLFTGTAGTDTYTFDIAGGASFEIKGRIGSNDLPAASPSTRSYIKSGAGTLLLSGSNGGTGAWTHSGFLINEGAVRLASTNALGLSGNKFTVASGAALEFSGTFNAGQINAAHTISGTGIGATGALRNISGNSALQGGGTGSITLGAHTSIGADAGTLTIATSIADGGNAFSLTKVGAGNLVLSGVNTYTGSTTLSEGILALGNLNALGTIPGTNGTSGISMAAATSLQSNTTGGSTVAAPLTLSGAGDTKLIIAQGASGTTHTFTLNGSIGGATGNQIFTTAANSFANGTSRFIIGAAGNYTGDTQISTGNGGNNPVFVRAGAGIVNALPATTVLTFANVAGGGTGRTFQYEMNGGDQTLAGLSNGGVVPSLRRQQFTNVGALATLTINNTADFTFGGSDLTTTSTNRAQIQGAIALTKSGVGTFTLGGTLSGGATAGGHTFTGPTTILAGVLVLGETLSLQNSAVDTANSITGDGTNGLRTTVTALTLGGLIGSENFADVFTTATGGPTSTTPRGGYDGLTALTLNPGAGATHRYAGNIGNGIGSMSLTKTGTGTQILSGANTYTGVSTISAGTLQFAKTSSLYSSPASWTATNIKVGSTATLALNVGGANEFTATDVTTLLSALGGANGTATTGFATGSTLGFDTTNASGGSFPYAGSITDSSGSGGGTIGLTKLGTNTLVLSGLSATAASNYTGTTAINEGTLAFTTPHPALTGGLTFGSASTILTPGILDLTTANATFGGPLFVNTNSATASEIIIGPSRTLTINNAVQIGATTPAVTGTFTKLAMTGGGAFNVTGATFAVGGSSSATVSQDSTLDLTALSATTLNLTGNFRISPNTTTNIGGQARMLLPTPAVADTVATTTITSTGGNITVGGGGSYFNSSLMNSLTLGTGLTRLNASNINVASGGRDLGQILYGQTAGDLVIRAGDGTSRATAINVGALGGATAASGAPILMDLAGHDADILVTSLNVGNQGRTATQLFQFNFGEGDNSLASKLDATHVNIGFRPSVASNTQTVTGRVNLSGGTVTLGDAGGAGNGVDIGNSSYVNAGVNSTVGELNISAGNVTLHNSASLGAAVRLGTNSDAVDAGGTVTASLNLTGGTTTLGGDIIRNVVSPRTTSIVKISGGTLNMGGNDIGTLAEPITLSAESGTLQNVATLNGSGGLTKTTAGALDVSGTITYAGNTVVSAGTLTLGTANPANNASAVAIAATGATLNLTYAGTDPVNRLFIGASQLASGVYGKIGSAFPTIGLSQITGDGTLTVSSNPTYASWIGFFFPGETNPSIIGASADPDFDGIGNAVEMVIGGDPKLGMDAALLPTLERVTNPVGSPAITPGDYLLFTYRRSDSAVTAGLTADCETDTDLVAPWTTATGAPGVVIQVDNNFTFTPPASADTDRVRVYVPRGANTKLFGRLKVIQLP